MDTSYRNRPTEERFVNPTGTIGTVGTPTTNSHTYKVLHRVRIGPPYPHSMSGSIWNGASFHSFNLVHPDLAL